MVLAALLVLGSGLAVAAWGLHAGEKTSVVVLTTPIAKGQVIEREDLASRAVAGVSDAIGVEDADSVVGQTAAVDLVQGQILTSAVVTSEPLPGPGQSMIGLALDPTRVPGAGLEAGDQVDVIAVPAGGNDSGGEQGDTSLDDPVLLTTTAQVFAVGGEAAAGGLVLVTLLVDESDASKVAAYSTQNRVAVVETAPTGSPAGDGE